MECHRMDWECTSLPPNFSPSRVLVSTLCRERASGHSLSASASMSAYLLHQFSSLAGSCICTDMWTYTLSHTHVIISSYLLLVLIISTFVFIFFPFSFFFFHFSESLTGYMTFWHTARVFVPHVTVSSHGHASVHSVISACVYRERMSQLSVRLICGGTAFPETNVARSRLHDDGEGNENI